MEKMMGKDLFERICKGIISQYYEEDLGIECSREQIYMTSYMHQLQNEKGMFSTTRKGDHHYFEMTYNGDKRELYVDVYDKEKNMCIHIPGYEEIQAEADEMFTLLETVDSMCSPDYKRRFLAEYYQLKIRYEKLFTLVDKMRAHKLSFSPTCSIDDFEEQLKGMYRYLTALQTRAEKEGIPVTGLNFSSGS